MDQYDDYSLYFSKLLQLVVRSRSTITMRKRSSESYLTHATTHIESNETSTICSWTLLPPSSPHSFEWLIRPICLPKYSNRRYRDSWSSVISSRIIRKVGMYLPPDLGSCTNFVKSPFSRTLARYLASSCLEMSRFICDQFSTLRWSLCLWWLFPLRSVKGSQSWRD